MQSCNELMCDDLLQKLLKDGQIQIDVTSRILINNDIKDDDDDENNSNININSNGIHIDSSNNINSIMQSCNELMCDDLLQKLLKDGQIQIDITSSILINNDIKDDDDEENNSNININSDIIQIDSTNNINLIMESCNDKKKSTQKKTTSEECEIILSNMSNLNRIQIDSSTGIFINNNNYDDEDESNNYSNININSNEIIIDSNNDNINLLLQMCNQSSNIINPKRNAKAEKMLENEKELINKNPKRIKKLSS